jgi:hypothetical protein
MHTKKELLLAAAAALLLFFIPMFLIFSSGGTEPPMQDGDKDVITSENFWEPKYDIYGRIITSRAPMDRWGIEDYNHDSQKTIENTDEEDLWFSPTHQPKYHRKNLGS